MTDIKSLGQYFTPPPITNLMVNLISIKTPTAILEPSAGEGVFLRLLKNFKNCEIVGIEVDDSLSNKSDVDIEYMDFFDYPINKKFNIVIGNPPYVRWKHQSNDKRKKLLERNFWGKRMNGLTDLLQPFIFKSIDHLMSDGELIFITPKFWLQTLHSRPLRDYILEKGQIDIIIDLNEKQVFPKVSLNLVIFKFVKKKTNKKCKVIKFHKKGKVTENEILKVIQTIKDLDNLNSNMVFEEHSFKAFLIDKPKNSDKWYFIPKKDLQFIHEFEESCKFSPKITLAHKSKSISCLLIDLLTKEDLLNNNLNIKDFISVIFHNKKFFLRKPIKTLNNYIKSDLKTKKTISRYIRLGDIVEIGNGMVSGLDKAFKIGDITNLTVNEKKSIINVIKSKSLHQYFSEEAHTYFFIPQNKIRTENDFKVFFPNFYSILKPFKQNLGNRWTPSPISWWEWAFPRNKKLFESSAHKIFVPCKDRFDKRNYVRFSYCKGNFYANQDVTVIVKNNWVQESNEYLVAYLNSRILFRWLINKGLIRGGVLEFSEKPLNEIPFRFIDWNIEREVLIHDNITQLTKKLISSDKTNLENTKLKLDNLLSELMFNH